jgi:hypothetical protein
MPLSWKVAPLGETPRPRFPLRDFGTGLDLSIPALIACTDSFHSRVSHGTNQGYAPISDHLTTQEIGQRKTTFPARAIAHSRIR